ncbi:MAG: nucleotidyl transferase AbiEii/AbiGii toxin family protein [Candidatus Omnitrophica bacterium]|nr:nucleotidyl transferase AbiEii/AbiGii toxin family protein [Candidatus Omnitrophota bacterium]
MKTKVIDYQNKVLEVLSNKIDDFYLGGGTALSLYYFNHRQSLDLDFFTQSFSKIRVLEIVKFLSLTLKKKIGIIAEEARKNRVKILVYSIGINAKESLKLDFVQDYLERIKPTKIINGIKVLSLEDIYVRKIYALTGTLQTEDSIGKRISKGGRQEAKDFYDLYCLSQIFMKLSDFSLRFGNPLMRETLIRWFNTYSRLDMKTGLLELQSKKNIDYSDIERHFKKEIDRIIEKEVESI